MTSNLLCGRNSVNWVGGKADKVTPFMEFPDK